MRLKSNRLKGRSLQRRISRRRGRRQVKASVYPGQTSMATLGRGEKSLGKHPESGHLRCCVTARRETGRSRRSRKGLDQTWLKALPKKAFWCTENGNPGLIYKEFQMGPLVMVL